MKHKYIYFFPVNIKIHLKKNVKKIKEKYCGSFVKM